MSDWSIDDEIIDEDLIDDELDDELIRVRKKKPPKGSKKKGKKKKKGSDYRRRRCLLRTEADGKVFLRYGTGGFIGVFPYREREIIGCTEL